jgi:hypothetical protein
VPELELAHLLGPRERKDVAPALLLAGRAHALERQGLGNGLARAAHRPGRVDAEQDGPAVGGRAHLAAVVRGHARRELAPPVALVRLQALLGEAREEEQARLAHAPPARERGGLGGQQAPEVAAAREPARLLGLERRAQEARPAAHVEALDGGAAVFVFLGGCCLFLCA